MLSLLTMLPAAALADTTARGYRPHPNHLGVVVTHHLVYITWSTPPGVLPAKVFAMRGAAGACPTSPANGTRVGATSVTNHMIDPGVTAGDSYCYSVFVADSAGAVTKVGTTGSVLVPDLNAPPPAAAVSPAPVAQTPASAGGLGTMSKAIAGALGGLLAFALLVVILRVVRRSRTANAGPAFGSELRMTFTGLSGAALIIPAVIALAWVLVVTAVVVFR